ncbi:MAG: AMP-binding protein [Candidatus Woesearchaeota archaeon]
MKYFKNCENLADLYESISKRYSGTFLYDLRTNEVINYDQFRDYAYRLAQYFKDSGIAKGDKVSIFMENSPWWLISDYALHLIGAVNVARTSEDLSELEFILKHSDSKLLIHDKKHELKADIPKLLKEDLVFIAKSYKPLEKREKTSLDDVATIVYTSGTTSNPKGVMLTHENILYDAQAYMDEAKKYFSIDQNDAIISILPEWHMYQRIIEYGAISEGVKIYYDSLKNFKKNSLFMKEITIIPGVPALWMNVKKEIERKIHESKILGKIYDTLYEKSKNYHVKKALGQESTFVEKIASSMFEFIFAKKIREKLGNKKFLISGGSYLSRDVEDFFLTIGIPLVNGYGLTETSPVVCVKFSERDLYSLGKPLKGIEVRLNDEGVLEVKGPIVMKGYYKNEEATKEVLSDGWFSTGDRFEIRNGNLFFYDRRKDIIVLPSGEKVSPQKLETIIEQYPNVKFAFVFGGKDMGLKDQIAALLVIDESVKDKNKFVNEIKEYLRQKDLNPYERVNTFFVTYDNFSVGKELTSTLKKKRQTIYEKVRHLLNSGSLGEIISLKDTGNIGI